MHFEIDRDLFGKLLARVARVVDGRAVSAAYRYARLIAEDNRLVLQGSSETTHLSTHGPCFVKKAGKLGVPPKDLADKIRRMPPGPVSVKIGPKGDRVEIATKGIRRAYTVFVVNESDLPALHKSSGVELAALDKDQRAALSSGLARTLVASATVPERAFLYGVTFDFLDKTLLLGGSDGYAMHLVRVPSIRGNDAFVLHHHAAKAVAPELADGEGPMAFGMCREGFTFEIEETKIFVPHITANAFNYRGFIPPRAQMPTRVKVGRVLLLEGLRAIEGIWADCALQMTDHGIEIRSASGRAAGVEEVDAEVEGPHLKIWFRTELLVRTIQAATGEMLGIFFGDDKAHALVECEDFQGVALPVRPEHGAQHEQEVEA